MPPAGYPAFLQYLQSGRVRKTKGTLFGRSFWARGYCVSTVGLDEDQIRRCIRDQEKLQQDRDQGELNFE
jgi:REP element-mobilizing transposase RayT